MVEEWRATPYSAVGSTASTRTSTPWTTFMTHHKFRKKRRKNGIKGCCCLCASRTRLSGLRNKRLPTVQELKAPKKGEWVA